jgi:hypothetical protein
VLRKVKAALRLRPRDWLVVSEAWWTLALVRVRLLIDRSRVIEQALAVRESGEGRADELQRIVRLFAIAAGNHVTEMNCLPRSLALQKMALRRGIHPVLRIGVRREGSGSLEAHAWLELESMPLGDSADVTTRFSMLKGTQP